jgi:hypothetical protein
MGEGVSGSRLFLSHAGIDSEAALRLAERISASPEAQAQGLTVWIDKDYLGAGGRWKDQLQEALKESSAFAVYVGSKGVVNWVWDEVSVALDRAHHDTAYPLIPILAKGADKKALPSFLSQYQGVSAVEEDPEQFLKLLRGVLRLDSRAGVTAECDPFVGLQAFDSRKAHLFFGRRREVDDLVELLRSEYLLMVVATAVRASPRSSEPGWYRPSGAAGWRSRARMVRTRRSGTWSRSGPATTPSGAWRTGCCMRLRPRGWDPGKRSSLPT